MEKVRKFDQLRFPLKSQMLIWWQNLISGLGLEATSILASLTPTYFDCEYERKSKLRETRLAWWFVSSPPSA
jgi:hypothetical protein